MPATKRSRSPDWKTRSSTSCSTKPDHRGITCGIDAFTFRQAMAISRKDAATGPVRRASTRPTTGPTTAATIACSTPTSDRRLPPRAVDVAPVAAGLPRPHARARSRPTMAAAGRRPTGGTTARRSGRRAHLDRVRRRRRWRSAANGASVRRCRPVRWPRPSRRGPASTGPRIIRRPASRSASARRARPAADHRHGRVEPARSGPLNADTVRPKAAADAAALRRRFEVDESADADLQYRGSVEEMDAHVADA